MDPETTEGVCEGGSLWEMLDDFLSFAEKSQ